MSVAQLVGVTNSSVQGSVEGVRQKSNKIGAMAMTFVCRELATYITIRFQLC